jgi:CRISPR-associated endonuclease Csn1
MRILGIDGGIASIGWAVLDVGPDGDTIAAAGTRMFDAPETDKERTPTNAIRREKRGQRRVVRRRQQRMSAIRILLVQYGLLQSNTSSALATKLDPWQLRAEALDRRLLPAELATVLGHIAKHRGFRSNAKTDRGANSADDSSKMRSAIEATKERLSQWRTVGEMFARDPQFKDTKRNRGGGFARSILRDDQEVEIHKIFQAQRRLGNSDAREELELQFIEAAFSQRPLRDSDELVGTCPFMPAHRRAARRSHAFEMFRLLGRLNTLRINAADGHERKLSPEEINLALDDFGIQKTLSYKWLRKKIDLEDSAAFADKSRADEGHDVVARSGSAAEGTYALRKAVGDAGWRALMNRPGILDAIAAILSFRSDLASIRAGIAALDIDPALADTIATAAEAGAFNAFKGAGHISAEAARVLLPHLARGLVYSEACAEAGFDHAARASVSIADIRNPVARKSVSELVKQVRVVMAEFGPIDRIHVELARDVGKSSEERDEITRGIEKRNRERDKTRGRFAELLGRLPQTQEELLRFELWQEQDGWCLYTGDAIPVTALLGAENLVQVDHILPWSRFGDDSFLNKTICYASANANKRDRTPFEWFTQDRTVEAFRAYEARVEACRAMKGGKKRRHYLRRNAAEVEERFRARNLGDTRYVTRLALDMLARLFPEDGTRHVLARPGALTAKLRRGWGLEGLKKDQDGKRRNDDRHHALDAIVVAACTEPMLNSLTRKFQQAERQGMARDFSALDQPWPGFREAANAAFESVFVSRAERHRARGEAHAATIRQVRVRDGKEIVYERKGIDALKPADLLRVKDADRNVAIIESLRAWMEAGRPRDKPPLSPNGDVVRKIRLATKDKPAVMIRGGTADRGDMARVDVFRKDDAKGRPRFYLVPIYPHQIVSMQAPPNRAVDAGKAEAVWTTIDATYSFLFGLFGNSYLEIAKSDGEVIEGYFKGLDRSVAAVAISDHRDPLMKKTGIGTRTVLSLRKFQVDRLGRRYEIKAETRTWHGVACT